MFFAKRQSQKSGRRRSKRVPIIPTLLLVAFVFAAVFAGFMAPHDPLKPSLKSRLKPPVWQDGGTWSHPLGTDLLGRDTLSRLIYGARISLVIVIFVLVIGGSIGGMLGLISGYYGGKIDALIMRTSDAMMAFPILFIALLLVVSLGASLMNIVISLSLVLWARYARLIRGEVLMLMQRDFIAFAKMSGCSALRIMLRHLFPNVLNSFVVALTLQVGWVILVEAVLSFLGAGVPPPEPTWGAMVARGRAYIDSAWWLSAIPGIAIFLVVMSFNLFGDWLRDVLDPKLREM